MGGSGFFWVEMGEFSSFWCFFMKPADSERVSWAVIMVVCAKGKWASSSSFKTPDMSGSGVIWVKIGGFSTFWWILVNPAISERFSWSVMIEVRAGDPVGACDSKTARKNALFSCPVEFGVAWVNDDLAVVVNVGDCETELSGVARLVWTRVPSFVGLKGLGGGVFGVDWLVMCNFSGFSSFWAKLAVIDRVSKAVVTVNGASGFGEVADSVDEEKTAIFGEFSHIFEFFLLPESTRDCDMAAWVGEPMLGFWDILALVWVPTVDGGIEGAAGTEVDSDEGGWMM
jgi:hypothetical protein